MKKTLLAVAVAAISMVGANAQIWSNPITGTNPNTSNPFTSGDVVVANLTVSGIGRGAGATGTSANNRYNANSWNTTSIDVTAYFTFTLTPASGYEIDFTSLTGSYQASDNNPVTTYALRSSLDGFTADIATGSISATGSAVAFNFDLSAPAFDSITAPVEFRLYAWGNASTSGTSTFSVNDFAFNGSVTAVPEPATATMLLGGVGSMFWVLRRKRVA